MVDLPPPPPAAIVRLHTGTSPGVVGPGARRLWPGSDLVVVPLRPGNVTADLARLRATPGVATVERDRRRSVLGFEDAAEEAVVGDPLRRLQPYLTQVRWTPPARRERAVSVAVLDTGIDGDVPDLVGVVDEKRSRSFAPGAADPLTDSEGHGTHVAGTIAAKSDNGVGISGIARARLMAVKVADRRGQASTSSIVSGIHYAVARGARVLNLSFGGGGRSALEQTAIDRAVRAGVLVVAAAGNTGERGRTPEYPGAYRHVLTVGAVDDRGTPSRTSTAGPQVEMSAPGEDVLSAVPPMGSRPARYAERSGTSMSAAMVSGAAARILARRPRLDPSQVATILTSTARDVGARGVDEVTGSGMLDLAAALARRTPAPDSAEPNDDAAQARRTRPLLIGRGTAAASVGARIAAWDDPRDLYRVVVRAGDRLDLRAVAPRGGEVELRLWRPGTPASASDPQRHARHLVAQSAGPARRPALRIVAAESGVYLAEVHAEGDTNGLYRITARRTATS